MVETMNYSNTISRINDSRSFDELKTALLEVNVDWQPEEHDFYGSDEVAYRLTLDLSENGLEALRDYKDLDPFGEVFRQCVGYFENSNVDEVKEAVLDYLYEQIELENQER